MPQTVFVVLSTHQYDADDASDLLQGVFDSLDKAKAFAESEFGVTKWDSSSVRHIGLTEDGDCEAIICNNPLQ